MNYNSGKPNIMDSLKQKNKKSLNGIEMSLGETKIVTIPTQVREEELNLLRTAVNFQPELYEKISMIPTRKEMDLYMKEVLNIDVNYYQKMVDTYQKELTTLREDIRSDMKQTEKNIRNIETEMRENIKQAGKDLDSLASSVSKIVDDSSEDEEERRRRIEAEENSSNLGAVLGAVISLAGEALSSRKPKPEPEPEQEYEDYKDEYIEDEPEELGFGLSM